MNAQSRFGAQRFGILLARLSSAAAEATSASPTTQPSAAQLEGPQ